MTPIPPQGGLYSFGGVPEGLYAPLEDPDPRRRGVAGQLVKGVNEAFQLGDPIAQGLYGGTVVRHALPPALLVDTDKFSL
jgi:hypothetical protein